MQIFVVCLDTTLVIEVTLQDTLLQVQERVFQKLNWRLTPSCDVYFTLGGKIVNESATLKMLKVQGDDMIHIYLRIRGC